MKEEKLLKYVTKCETDNITDINFICRMMITSALPYSKVSGNTYTRTNGNCKLSITNGYDGILPYGSYPRVILSWIITEAVKTKSREIYLGESITGLMKQLGISVTGGKTGSFNRFKQQFISLMTSSITYSFVDPRMKKKTSY